MAVPYRILTVGDGDLSLSLALVRAFGDQIDLTASTLLESSDRLLETYPGSKAILSELGELSVPVLFAVDATQLHERFANHKAFDIVLFHHPHLGDYRTDDESAHLERHFVLLAHYLHSAASLVNEKGRVHLCLRASQPKAWQMHRAASLAGLVECTLCETSAKPSPMPVQHPMHHMFTRNDWKANDPPKQTASRRSRQSRTSSRHWLGKYGYQHQFTFPSISSVWSKADLSGSHHYFFERTRDCTSPGEPRMESLPGRKFTAGLFCHICESSFSNANDLRTHLKAPSLPLALPPPTCEESVDDLSRAQKAECGDDKISPTIDDSAIKDNDRCSLAADGTQTTPIETWISKPILVDAAHDGKRLRWYLQHCVPVQGGKANYSKRESEQLITTGKVQLNGQVEMHSSRLLKAGDFVALSTSAMPSEMRSKHSASLEIIDSWSSTCFVVWKPVGMRPTGSFDENTMERIFSEQQNGIYKSMSKIDTGCSGLCLLSSEVAIDQVKSSPLTHTFTALVHGHVPEQWVGGVDINLSIDELRRWKKKRKAASSTPNVCRAQVRCLEQTSVRETLPALSTVQISVDSDVSGLANIISYYLRKDAAHPVVGDRFTSSEYLALPRSIRNRLKQRLCMSCTGIASKTQRTEHPLPEKLRATFWEEHSENAFPRLGHQAHSNTD